MRAALLTLIAGLLLASSGCAGYRFAETYDEGIHSVNVPIFANETFSRGVELLVTDAVIKHIQRRTPWVVVQSQEADSTLTGVIRDARIRELQQSTDTGTTLEAAYVIEVDFTFRDNRSGKVRVARQRFASAGSFVPNRVYGERLAVGEREASQALARDIVEELRSDW